MWTPDDETRLLPLGPPGWEEFQAARRRFEASLELLGADGGAPRPTTPGTFTERDMGRMWR